MTNTTTSTGVWPNVLRCPDCLGQLERLSTGEAAIICQRCGHAWLKPAKQGAPLERVGEKLVIPRG